MYCRPLKIDLARMVHKNVEGCFESSPDLDSPANWSMIEGRSREKRRNATKYTERRDPMEEEYARPDEDVCAKRGTNHLEDLRGKQ
jgi:hypothetical protein